MVEGHEVIALITVVIGFVPTILFYRQYPETKWYLVGFSCLLIGTVASMAKYFAYPDMFYLLEHIFGVFGAGIFLAGYAYSYYCGVSLLRRKMESFSEKREKK